VFKYQCGVRNLRPFRHYISQSCSIAHPLFVLGRNMRAECTISTHYFEVIEIVPFRNFAQVTTNRHITCPSWLPILISISPRNCLPFIFHSMYENILSILWLLTRATAGALATYVLATIWERLFRHPLSGFPGPRLAAATDLYMAYYDVGGDLVDQLEILHEYYGERCHPRLQYFLAS
jgi:hypothetical protein